jgi:putative heme-binding domain-containing protein
MPLSFWVRANGASLLVVVVWLAIGVDATRGVEGNAGDIASPSDGRFVREHWAEFGMEHANPMSNRRFRVNAPEAVLHREFGSRSETKSSGCLQLLMNEDPRLLQGTELYLEVWGGHPGTANRRVTINGRTTYSIADHGGLVHCTYQYPQFELKRTDVVNGYNALQFAVDQGEIFWGHMIVDNACMRAILANDHPDLKKHGLLDFAAKVKAMPMKGERIRLLLDIPVGRVADIASVEFQGFYAGYDENGNELTRDWHGFTKGRQPQAILGRVSQAPFEVVWDTSMVPDQAEMAVRAIVRMKQEPNLCYQTIPLKGVELPRRGSRVELLTVSKLPEKFWSRVNRRKTCTIRLDADPSEIERADLHVVVWDGGKGSVENYFMLNGQPIMVAGEGKHDLIYTVTRIDAKHLKKGENEIVLNSDTEHHGIEVCLPGPALMVRKKVGNGRVGLGTPFGGPTVAQQRLYEQHALTHEGNAARGREIFLRESVTKCVVCHKVSEQGGEVGPDLSHIGGKFGRPHLIESLLEPSRQIVEGYRTAVVQTIDGAMHTGIVKEQSETQIALLDTAGKRSVIETSQIAGRKDSPLSLMPVGLMEQLEPEEFTDLVAYLETLRAGGKPTPGAGITGPISVPEGFRVRTVATGLSGATAMEVLPDGRVLICEQTGTLRVVRDSKLLDQPMLKLRVEAYWERGLIGVTVDPDFPRVPHLFVCYVAKEPYPHHVVSRFTVNGDVADAGSEKILLVGDDQRQLGGKVPAGHQGGGLHFGVDGKLYVGIGEQTAETPSQRLDTFQGKMLRINKDGTIPPDNPLLGQTDGKYRAIWAYGLRNPFTFAARPGTGELWINDVGGKFEEVNRGVAGANYGWPTVEHGTPDDNKFRGSVHSYPQASISGGDFCGSADAWPEIWRGRYFFADFVHGWIKAIDPDHPGRVEQFASGLSRPVDLRFGPRGELYVLLRNAWVMDGKFQAGTSALLEIVSKPVVSQ